MKRLFIYTVMLLMTLTVGAQKVKPVQYGGMCQLHSVKDKAAGVYVIACNGYGKNDALAKEDAEIRVVRQLHRPEAIQGLHHERHPGGSPHQGQGRQDQEGQFPHHGQRGRTRQIPKEEWAEEARILNH